MKTSFNAIAAAFGGLALALLFAPNSKAQCGRFSQPKVSPSGWHSQPGQPRLLRTAFTVNDDENARELNDSDQAAIVGFWHVKLFSKGSDGITDGTEIDAGYSQWHSDGTEVLNSAGRQPSTGNVCFGVWKQVGHRKYNLKHMTSPWDDAQTHLIGPGVIHEEVVLAPDSNHYAGTFTIDNYDEAGNLLSHLQGVTTATRITVDTPESSIF